MKINSRVALTMVCFGLCACTTQQIDPKTEISLRPVHSFTTGLEDSERSQIHITDNDGNLYVTYWDTGSDDDETFTKNSVDCRNKLSDQRLFTKNLVLTDLSEEQIKPSAYVPFIKCIHAFGYNLVDKEGYAPDEYTLTFSRSHLSRRGEYLPVGGNLILRKEEARYIDVYRDVIACEAQALEGEEDAAIEEYDSLYMKVSLKVFAEKMKACLLSKSYNVEQNWS